MWTYTHCCWRKEINLTQINNFNWSSNVVLQCSLVLFCLVLWSYVVLDTCVSYIENKLFSSSRTLSRCYLYLIDLYNFIRWIDMLQLHSKKSLKIHHCDLNEFTIVQDYFPRKQAAKLSSFQNIFRFSTRKAPTVKIIENG